MRNLTIPYTYLIHCTPTNQWYYGVRWAKGCHPEELWKNYFTSSNQISFLRVLFGDENFKVEIRRTFKSAGAARNWEHKVLRRIGVIQKPDRWLNRTDNKAILNLSQYDRSGTKNPMYGKKHTKEAKQKNREKHIGKLLGDNNPSKRIEVRRAISENNPMKRTGIAMLFSDRMIGNRIGLGNTNAKVLRGRKQSPEHVAKRVASRKRGIK